MNQVKLSKLIEIGNGRNYSTISAIGNYPVYGSGGIMGYTEDYLYEGESVLLPRKGTLDNIQYVSGKFWTVDTIYFSKIDNSKVDPYFLYRYLKQLNLSNLNTGTGVPSMTQKSYEDIPLEIPDLTKQKVIANTLKLLDNKIALNDKISAKLEEIARLIYDYWFVQFDFPDANNRPYKTAGGAMVYNEELKREIPAGWQVKRVSDYLSVITGKEDANFATKNGEYAYFTCGKPILRCDHAKYEGKSVLIAGNGTFDVKYYSGKFNAYQRVYVLTPKDERFVGIIYKNALDSIARFTRGSNGSIVKFITKGDVENIKILVPENLGLLEPFNTALDAIEKNNESSAELTKLRDWLLPMLMNGQARISQ